MNKKTNNNMKNFLRKFFNLFLPPIFKNIIKILFRKEDISFVGRFKTKEEAYNHNKEITKYLNSELENKNSNTYIENVKFSQVDRNAILPIITSISEKQIIKILDIGGGNPSIHEYIKNSTTKEIKSFVLEREPFVNRFIKKIPDVRKTELFYISSFRDVQNENFDIIYFGSSLQYIDNHENFLNEVLISEPEYVIITDTVFTNLDEDFYVLQVNMRPSIFPNLFLSNKNFLNFMKNNGYDCVFNLNNQSIHKHNLLNGNEYNFKHLIFKRL